jgi:hypothetical protein
MPPAPRTFVEEESFAEAKALIDDNAPRLDEVLRGVVFQICRDPERGALIPGTQLRVTISSGAFDSAPEVAVVYRFDEDYAYGLWVEPY